MTAIKDSVVLVTGGSRGIGKALVEELYARGAGKVYATARDPRSVTHPDAVALALEVTNPDSVAAVAEQAQDVTVLINNAGAATRSRFLTSSLDDIRRVFEINFYGPLLLTRAFAPVIERNGGGHILNVLSVHSWFARAEGGAYSASKSAFWSQTNSLRQALQPQGIGVTGLHMGLVDTDMTAHVDALKISPRDVAVAALDGVESDAFEVLTDDLTRWVKDALSGDPVAMYERLAAR
ncbi:MULTISPECIES: SDR family oxidoreductase [unclassified Streptomyces]|uniref:SDR family oxidoreductase n=1 Tax=unclassified Streptomyces TaxID=2593676 RepID=UPI00035EFD10|nr:MULTISPECIES: SDR family oxidoreductase [unclassified Streptomyces]MYX37442.1 SDR family NAD(P)-dependent oxidoreductase [Streptomyces sp. SID8377]